VLTGKLLGSLIMPLFQMTAVFPVLFIFVASGNLGAFDVVSLYVYSAALMITSGILDSGLRPPRQRPMKRTASARTRIAVLLRSSTGHPFLRPIALLAFLALLTVITVSSRQTSRSIIPLAGLTLAVGINPGSVSPLLAPLSFLPILSGSGLHTFWNLIIGSKGILAFPHS